MKLNVPRYIAIIAVATIVVLFQNCSGTSPFESSSSSTSEKSGNPTIGGNGEPYGGKISKYQSYMEGFYCPSSDGNNVPSPYAIVEKNGDTFKLVKQACEDKNEVLNPALFSEDSINNSATFDFRRFYKNQDFINDVLLPKFNFDESMCEETVESRLLRKYGTTMLTPDQMKSATADNVEIKVFSMFYGKRFAEISIIKDLPIIILSPVRDLKVEKYTVDIPTADIQATSVFYESTASTNSINMTIGKDKNLPVNIKGRYVGTLEYSNTTVNLSNIKITCAIYPHY